MDSSLVDYISLHDLAVVRLAEKVNSPLRPANLSSAIPPKAKSLALRTYGFGLTAIDVPPDGNLRNIDQKGKLDRKFDRFLFDQSHGQGICFGDSGGPSFLRGTTELVSVTTNLTRYELGGIPGCRETGAAFLIRGDLPWIRSAIRTLRDKN